MVKFEARDSKTGKLEFSAQYNQSGPAGEMYVDKSFGFGNENSLKLNYKNGRPVGEMEEYYDNGKLYRKSTLRKKNNFHPFSNPDDFKDQVVQKANHFSNQAAEAVNQAKEKVESGEITGETILDSVKEATKQVVDFSQEKFQEWKEKMESEGISPEEFKKSAPESAENEPTSEDIVIDLTENQELENEDKKIED